MAPRWSLSAVLFFVVLSLGAQEAARTPWSEVAPPRLVSAGVLSSSPGRLTLVFDLVTAAEGADKATVEILGASGVLETRALGKSKNPRKTIEFAPTASGTYRFRVLALRNGEAEAKSLTTDDIPFVLPLSQPSASARNLGRGDLALAWDPVPEAEAFAVEWKTGDGPVSRLVASAPPTLTGLVVGASYALSVTPLRAGVPGPEARITKRVKAEPDRPWSFTWFGQSSSASVNRVKVLDEDDLKLQLFSTTFLPNGSVDAKGGKFTTFHDGISFYYTPIDVARENFELTATFTVDGLNPVPDGQEGFGLLVMDSLGAQGVSMVNHYTNSAGLIATKFEGVVDGVKRTSKDTLGSRFVSGITPEVLALGDTGIARFGVNASAAFSYETADLVKQGGVYTLTLKKSNTGYHVVWGGEERILYGVEKLAALDPARDYLGFAVARGANVTVSDVRLTFSDAATDPPAQEEPPVLVPLTARVDAPSASGSTQYPFVFTANADGNLALTSGGKTLAGPVTLKAGERWARSLTLVSGQNDFGVRFEVSPAYRPGPKMRMAETSATFVHTVYQKSYPGRVLYAAPHGSSLGLGTKEKPLSLASALAFVGPGQTIELADGVYRPRTALVVERGNDGSPGSPKVLRAAAGTRPVLDFQFSTGGLQLWGNDWVFEGFDVTATPGNVKGLQVGGNRNVVRGVNTYLCGDTGLQISGNSADAPALWPADNLVVNCTSWGNNDPAQNNADGFAAKLTCGPGNVFRGCLAYHNIDDGWDLFSKIESGPIGAVVIESCVAYRNGSLPDGSGNGDGNGFKLGGDGIAVAHLLRNSVAFANGASGITSNSDPAVILERNTSFANQGSNINLYGKGDGVRAFQARGNLSLKGGSADVYREMPELASVDNFFWNGAQSLNVEGSQASVAWFVQADPKTVPERRADGSLDLKGFLVLTSLAQPGVGARLP